MQRNLNWLIVSLRLPVIIKMIRPPSVLAREVTKTTASVLLPALQQGGHPCWAFGFVSKSTESKPWLNGFSATPWETSYLSAACREPRY